MRERLYAPEDKRWIFNKLRRTSENIDGIFETNKDIFIFAASIGFNHEQSLEVTKRDVEIPFHIFTKDNKDFIDVIVLGSTLDSNDIEKGDVSLLSWQDDGVVERKLSLFEEYANGGLTILDQVLFQNKTTIYDNLIQLLHDEADNKYKEDDSIGNLKDIMMQEI